MLESTFIHVPGIGLKTEQLLWSQGVTDWDRYIDASSEQLCFPGLRAATPSRSLRYDFIQQSVDALARRDHRFFSRAIPRSEHWRMYSEFRDDFVFLDVETTGLSRVYDKLTVIGLYSAGGYQAFIEGHNLDDVVNALSEHKMLVTFNGALFDLPFIREAYPQISPPEVHIDLRFLLRRVGLRGSLKLIEREVGIERTAADGDMTGFDATVLWSRYARGETGALAELIGYNFEDTFNLQILMDLAFTQLSGLTCPVVSRSIQQPGLRKPNVSIDQGGIDIGGRRIELHAAPERRFPVQMWQLLNAASPTGRPPRIVGIDLTGSERRPSGWALLVDDQVDTARVHSDDDLVRLCLEAGADLVSIDSPLALPRGRDSVYDDHSGAGISRECERYLKRIGVSVFWCLLPSMMDLTARGIRLADRLRSEGIEVIESFPGAAQDILQIPRKKASREELKEGLASFGIAGTYQHFPVSHDELDAITSALVGLFYLAGSYEGLGNTEEGYLIVPSVDGRTPRVS